ncbi:hypothetical protein H0A36_24200 [Endozoicomonas sp. SM1973]|uniref:Uncharacterized protein n=1 Tax=Spartinivicinus marinus TaxID=2994442 RepID=A0A853IMU4_9GAMM|nr:hypothetical protein [Spartinivicinus marinus]NYZ69126.1 hypothetical protein [Spartinivicinus marinus]
MPYIEKPLTHEMCLRIQRDLAPDWAEFAKTREMIWGCRYSNDKVSVYETSFGEIDLYSDSTYVQEVDGDGYFLLIEEHEIKVFCLYFEGKPYHISTYFLSDYLATPIYIEDDAERQRVMDAVMEALSVYDEFCLASWMVDYGFKDKDYYEANKPSGNGWA